MKWERKPLTDFVWFQRGFDLPKDKFINGEFPVVGSTSILGYHTEAKVKAPGIVTGRSGTIGQFQYLKNDFWPHNTSLWVKDFYGNDERFAFYLLHTLDFISLNGGGAVPSLNRNFLSSINVNVPPLPTQRKIASILSAYDDLIENNLKRIKLLEEKAGLMFRMMQEELKDSTKINLYDFADVQMGFAFKAEAFNETREGIPIIRIRDIPNQITKSYTTQEVEPNYFVEKGDLLIGMDGEFHMNEWLGQRGYLVQRVCRLRTKNPLFQSYLWQALKEPIHYYETTISGATVAHLGKKHLEEIFIAEPKGSMKNELEEMNTMRKLKIVLADQNTKLREARDILLPKLMNGQIEV